MADKPKKPKFSFKELPVYCKVLRIVAAVLMAIGAVWMIIAAIVCINNPYAFGLYFGALGFLIPACAAAIVEYILEKKWTEKRMAEGDKPQPKQETKSGVWYCPNCGHENTDAFCSECGTKRPEEIVPSKEESPVVEEKAEESKDNLEVVDPARAERQEKVQKILNIAIPLGTVGIMAVWYALATLIDFIVEIVHFADYKGENPGDYIARFCSCQLFEMFGLIVTTAVAAIIVVIHLTSKFNAIKAFKLLPLLPAGLMFFIPVSIIGAFIYLKVNLPSDLPLEITEKGIAVIVMGFLSVGLCIAAFIVSSIFAKKNRLIGNIAVAAAMLFSAIVLFLQASSGLDWHVAPAYVALGIFMMLAAAGNFFIKEN